MASPGDLLVVTTKTELPIFPELRHVTELWALKDEPWYVDPLVCDKRPLRGRWEQELALARLYTELKVSLEMLDGAQWRYWSCCFSPQNNSGLSGLLGFTGTVESLFHRIRLSAKLHQMSVRSGNPERYVCVCVLDKA